MVLMTRGLPVLLEIGLLVFCVVDCLQTPRGATRFLGRRLWLVLIVLVPLAGGLAWLFAGRPRRHGRTRPTAYGPSSHAGPGRPLGPDDDPQFIADLDRRVKGLDDPDQR